ncbi:hypothetical protein KKG58_04535 [Patescibacteria group bacterium]|nr:hypothetical protein [Patescibacteria group bacterium]
MENQNNYNIHLDQNRSRSDSQNEQKPVFEHDDDEIDLKDYINVLIKRKWGILSIFAVVVIIAVVISLLLPLTFQASNLVKVGQIKGSSLQSHADIQSVFNRGTVLKQIKTKLQQPLELPETTSIESIAGMFDIKESLGDGKSGFIEINGRSDTPEKAVEVVDAVTDVLLTYHQNIFAEAEKMFDMEVETIKKSKTKTEQDINQIKTLDILKTEQEIKRLEQDIQGYEKEITKRDNIQSEGQGRIIESYINLLASVKDQKEAKERQIIDFKDNIRNLEQQLVSLDQSIQQKDYEKAYQTKPTKIEVQAIPPETRIAPKRKQNVMIAGILGLFIGVFYAFGAEYFSKSNTN